MDDSEHEEAEKRPPDAPSELARRQEGVVARRQLYERGIDRKQIARQVKRGQLHEIYPDVWALGHRNISPLGHLIAAVLSCGPDAFLSHRTAAAVHGLRKINTRAIEITVVEKRAPTRGALIMHRTRDDPVMEIRTRGLLRFSSVPRMFVELAKTESDAELDRLITLAVRKRLLNIDAVEQAIARHARRPGIAQLTQALGRYRPMPDRKSEFERAFDAGLLTRPDIPQPERNVYIAGWEIDCWWAQQRVALELDGRPYHVAVRDMDRDRLKDTKLQLLGIKPMRVTDFRFEHDPRGVYEDLKALLQLGRRLAE
jgi:very-short-patch-repair endonuclease